MLFSGLLLSRPFIIAQHFLINIEDICKVLMKPHGMCTSQSVLPSISLGLTNLSMQMAKTSPNWIFDKCQVTTTLTALKRGNRDREMEENIFDRLSIYDYDCECTILQINCEISAKFELKHEITQS